MIQGLPNQPDNNLYTQQSARPGDSQIAIQRKEELTSYVKSFYRASWDWRSNRYHAQWDKMDRNYHSIYDPTQLGRKEPWQSHMFVGVTIQNVEIICSQLFKTAMAPNPPVETEAGPDGDSLQAELIQDATAYEWNRAKYPIGFHDTLKEAIRYGSGFMKLYWDRIEDTRMRKQLQGPSVHDWVNNLSPDQLQGSSPVPPPQFNGYQMQPTRVLLKNGLCAENIHIRDIFPEPNTRDWKKYIHRQKMPFGWIMDNIKKKKFFDVSADLEGMVEGERFDDDLRTSKADRKFIDLTRIWSLYEKKHTIWELNAPIPRKWIQFDLPEDTPEQKQKAEELVPAKVLVASGGWLLSSEEDQTVDAIGDLIKMDYIRTGEPYGKGIIEMILDEQDEINELRNLRVDNVNMIMNKMMAVFEKAIVNRKDFISQPGGVIRLKDQVSDDIRKVITPLEFPDVSQSSFRETMEIERQIQERTGASRVTMGSSSMVRDTNQTLGGMELLKQMFNERVAAYGMLIESEFLIESAERTYSLIYQYLGPEDMKTILGTNPVPIADNPMNPMQPITVPRFMAWASVPPEMVKTSYRFKPMGIFSMENKIVKSAQVMDAIKVMSMLPPGQANIGAAIQFVLEKLQGIPEAAAWFQPFPNMPGIPGGAPQMPPMPGMPPGAPPPPGMTPPSQPQNGPVPGGIPPMTAPNHAPMPNMRQVAPGMKSGPNGNRPSFLPRNPIRRQPVA